MSSAHPPASAPAPAIASGDSVDLLVAGAGIFGLWAAKRGVEAGLRVMVVDPARPGAGASGGVLGALTAHAPDRWNAKKQFQFDALCELPALIAALEAETGLSTGYRRTGRIMPIRNQSYRAQVLARSETATRCWRRSETGLVYEARDDDGFADWLAPAERPSGYVWDSFAARVAPRAYLAALTAWLTPRADLRWGAGYAGWDGAAVLSDGGRVTAGAVAIAAGIDAFPALADAIGADAPLGTGIKGQSALLRLPPGAPPAAALPLIYEDGVYVAGHDDGLVAVSGTSEKDWDDPHSTDPSKDGFLRAARRLCPALAGAALQEWWAGVRPRARRRDPMIGRMPAAAPIYAMAGGYKISFGLAHRCAAALIAEIAGAAERPALPESFQPEHQLAGIGAG